MNGSIYIVCKPVHSDRLLAEKYQHQTTGTRFGQETRLDVTIHGLQKTIDVDGVVDGFLREAKYVDEASAFYSKHIGQAGTGLDVHVKGWADELQRLSLAAQQNGFYGVKVFTNSGAAMQKAIELFGQEDWFKMIQFVYEGVQ